MPDIVFAAGSRNAVTRKRRGSLGVGVIVDDVDEVRTVSSDQLEVTASADPDAVTAIATLDDRMVVLLNLTGLFGLNQLGVPAA